MKLLLLVCLLSLGFIFCVKAMDFNRESNECNECYDQRIRQALEKQLVLERSELNKKNEALLAARAMTEEIIQHEIDLRQKRNALLEPANGEKASRARGQREENPVCVPESRRKLLKRYFEEEGLLDKINRIIANRAQSGSE